MGSRYKDASTCTIQPACLQWPAERPETALSQTGERPPSLALMLREQINELHATIQVDSCTPCTYVRRVPDRLPARRRQPPLPCLHLFHPVCYYTDNSYYFLSQKGTCYPTAESTDQSVGHVWKAHAARQDFAASSSSGAPGRARPNCPSARPSQLYLLPRILLAKRLQATTTCRVKTKSNRPMSENSKSIGHVTMHDTTFNTTKSISRLTFLAFYSFEQVF
ncbi:hypothetical protein HDK90DRAFT_476262 [Phyllosticta capitalensis]|uniref:Uncharacterized protein n=1 Tax=Phyllosticta capitalensis TaxID=121624 RepID=A0ABR1YZL9_9PEZI